MSPLRRMSRSHMACFPRVSGDEPNQKVTTEEMNQFSPRERG